MKLNLDTLPFGRSALEVEETFLVEDEEGGGNGLTVRGELTVDNTDSRVLVAGVLASSGPAVCDRCLETFAMAYEAGVDIQIIRTKPGAPDEESPDTWILHQVARRGRPGRAPARGRAAGPADQAGLPRGLPGNLPHLRGGP